MDEQSVQPLTSGVVRTLLVGAGYGILISVSGTFASVFAQHVPLDWPALLRELSMAAPAGAIVALVLQFTKSFRERGLAYYYASWVFACTIALSILMLPLERSEGWWGIGFILWSGFSAGIALAAVARYVQRPREGG
jgi:hypothetical protein